MEEQAIEVVDEIVETEANEIGEEVPQNNQLHPDDHQVQGDVGDQAQGDRVPIQRPQRNRQAPTRLRDYVVNRLRRAWGGE